MIMPINCPICQNPLLNFFHPKFLKKECIHHTHCIIFICKSQEDIVDEIILIYDYQNNLTHYTIWWKINYSVKISSVKISENKSNTIELPYFEPDFSSFKNLQKKISTYILLS